MSKLAKMKSLYEEGLNSLSPERMKKYAMDQATDFVEKKKRQAKKYGLNMVRLGYDDPATRDRANYQHVKHLVKRVLAGDDLGLKVYEVSPERLKRENAWAFWKNDGVYLPSLEDVSKVTGSCNPRASRKQMEIHEKLEATIKPSKNEHDKLEAYNLKSLEELAKEGNPLAEEVYTTAMRSHSDRARNGDRASKNVLKHYRKLGQEQMPRGYLKAGVN
ncbi:MAG: hypothetical protein ACE5FW_02360 [Candidatus Aenigmatarchaeota archaeon]